MQPSSDYLKTDATNTSDLPILAWLGSVAIHVILGLALVFFYQNKPLPTDSGIETTLISAGELAEIEGQIKAHAAQSQQAGTTKTTNTKNTTSTTTAHSEQIQAYNDSLAQKEAEYQKQLAAFSAQLDAQTQADRQALETARLEADKQREAEVAALRQTAAKQHERERHNQEALAAAKAQNDEHNAQQEQERNASGQSGSLGDNTSIGNRQSIEQGGTHAQKTQSGGGAGADSIKAALISHIRPHWNYTTPDSKQILNAKISVDSAGNVISSSINGGTPELRNTLKSAIAQASPLTPIIGTNYTTLNIQFVTNQK